MLFCSEFSYGHENGYGQKDGKRIIVLNNSESFAIQISDSNVVYVIKDDIDLEDKAGKNPIKIPRNCRLDFQGGCLYNGVLEGEDLYFVGDYNNKIFVKIKGKNITPNFQVYNSPNLSNLLSTAYGNLMLMEDGQLTESVHLHSNLSAIHRNCRLTIGSSERISIAADNIIIKNIFIHKIVGEQLGSRIAIESNRGCSNILIDSCYITGGLKFANDKGVSNCRNLTISNCIIDCDFTNVQKRPSGDFQKDIITIRGMSDVFVYNNKIRGINVHRFWKSSGLIQPNGTITDNPTNISIHDNEIVCKSTDGNGKQLFDFFAGTLNVQVYSNTIDCSGHTIVFEDKTSTGYDTAKGTILFVNMPSSNIYVGNNIIRLTGGRGFRYSLAGKENKVIIEKNSITSQNSTGVFGRIENTDAIITHNTFKSTSSIKLFNISEMIFSNNRFNGSINIQNVSHASLNYNTIQGCKKYFVRVFGNNGVIDYCNNVTQNCEYHFFVSADDCKASNCVFSKLKASLTDEDKKPLIYYTGYENNKMKYIVNNIESENQICLKSKGKQGMVTLRK